MYDMSFLAFFYLHKYCIELLRISGLDLVPVSGICHVSEGDCIYHRYKN